jgi:hypothetical protein
MKSSKLIIYLLILAALSAYVYIVEIRQREQQNAEKQKAEKLVHLDRPEITQIALDSEKKGKIVLKKAAGTWVISSPVKTRADEYALDGLLTTISSAAQEKLLLDKDVKWSDYGLEKPTFTVTIGTKKIAARIFFGNQNPSKSSYYVRVNKSPKLLLVADTLKNALNKTLFELRDKTVLSRAPSDISRLSINLGDKIAEFKRETKDKWMMVKPKRIRVKRDVIDQNLRVLTNLKATDILDSPKKDGDPYGLKRPYKTILLAGNKPDQVLILGNVVKKDNGSASSNDVYARVKGLDTVYVLDKRSLARLQTDPKQIQDRSLVTLGPADVNKFEIQLEGETWEASREKEGKWLLSKPEKRKDIENWPVTRLLWGLKDLEWKSIIKGTADNLSQYHLDKPRLVVSLFKKKDNARITLKAGWSETAHPEKKTDTPKDNKIAEAKNDQKQAANPTPEKVYALVEPHEEKGAIFVLDSGFVERLRSGLKDLLKSK